MVQRHLLGEECYETYDGEDVTYHENITFTKDEMGDYVAYEDYKALRICYLKMYLIHALDNEKFDAYYEQCEQELKELREEMECSE